MSTRILALCGSLRAASLNAALLRATARLAPDGIAVELFRGMGELPLFNPDLESRLPEPAKRLHDAVATCDALLIASPEYAHGVTAVIKNALDWLVSYPPFVDKPVAVFNASPRSLHAEASLRETLTTMSARLLPEACLALPLRSTGIGEQGILDSEHAGAIRRALALLASGVPRA
jgi:NAD(P)H-dependent FMN reductase